MSTTSSKLITVIGATGAQGGSLIEALLEDKSYTVRGMTRNPDSQTAIKLKEKGVEVIYGDYDDPSTLDRVMANSYGVYVVTGAYNEKFYENKEVSRGISLVQAAIRAGVQHFVYSGQPSCKEVTGNAYSEFEGKSKVEKFMFESGLPSTSVRQPVAMENILLDFIPLLHDDGYYVWNLPMEGKPLPMIYPPSDGKALLAIFKNPEEYIGRTITIAGDCKTIDEYAAIASKHVAPYVIKASKMTADEFKKLDSPRAEDLGAMFEYFQADYSAYDVENTKQMDNESVDFDSFMKSNAPLLKKILECQIYDETIEKRSEFKGF